METLIIGQENVEVHDVVDSLSSPEFKILCCKELEKLLTNNTEPSLHNHKTENDQNKCLSNILTTWQTETLASGKEPFLAEIIKIIETKCCRPLLASHITNTFVKYVRDYKVIVKVPRSKICYYQGSKLDDSIFEGFYCEEVQKAAVKTIIGEGRLFDKKKLIMMIDLWKKQFDNHKNVVQLFGIALDNGTNFIGMELATSGNFQDMLGDAHRRRSLKHYQLVKLLRDIGSGLNWLHEKGICHGNIKPSNVLLFKHSNATTVTAKLSDFGIIRKSDDLLWMAPEEQIGVHGETMRNSTLENKKKIDIYSLGLIFYYVISRGSHAFRNKKYNHMEDEYVANNLVSWMLQDSPSNRPDIVQVVNHPFFWDALKNLRFLGDISRAANTTDDKRWSKIKRYIDNAYCKYFCKQRETESFNWRSFIDRKLLKRKSRKSQTIASSQVNKSINSASSQITFTNANDKVVQTEELDLDVPTDQYNTASLMALVKLIRDKEQHWTDMIDGLVANHFSDDNDGFSRVKYSKYFTDKFPDIIIIIFCALSFLAPHCKSLDVLQDDYLKYYSIKDLTKGWTDDCVQMFFGVMDGKLLPEIMDDA